MDIRENEKEYIIDAELPGIKKDNITIDINENNLTVSANYQEDKKEEKGNYIHRERRMSSMSRTVYLPDMDEDGVKAKYSDGILCITVPKKVESPKENNNGRINPRFQLKQTKRGWKSIMFIFIWKIK